MEDIKNFIEKAIKKKFSERTKGYDPNEVDEFLDKLIDKIRSLSDEIKMLNDNNDKLNYEIKKISNECNELLDKNKQLQSQVEEYLKSGYHNDAIMHRVNELEEKIAKSNRKDEK